MQQEKSDKREEGGTVTVTTGINTSILPGDAMSEVHSSITMASDSWKEQISWVCHNHSKALHTGTASRLVKKYKTSTMRPEKS